MFTETPPSGRRVRGKPPAPRLSMGPPQPPQNPTTHQQQQNGVRKVSSSVDHPATPLASVGPPNFSYGSATHALPRQISLADTNMSIFAAMKRAEKDAHERDVRAGKVVPEPEGQHPLVRFYEEPLEDIPTGPVNPPKIRALKDEPVRRGSPRRSTRNTRKSVERDQSIDSDMRRTPTPTPSEELVDEKPVTHVLVRESASPAKRSTAKARRAPAKKQEKSEVTLDSSNYEFSKDYSEEERAYQELKGRKGVHRAAIDSIKETQYEDDEEEEEEEEEDEDEEEEEEDEEEGEEDEEEEEEEICEDDPDYENQVFNYDGGFPEEEETEDFILHPRQSIFSPLKNAILFTYFFIHHLFASTFRKIKHVITRLVEIFVFTPILWVVDSFKSLFQTINSGISTVLRSLGAVGNNDIIKKAFATIVSIALISLAIPPTIQFLDNHNVLKTLTNFRFPGPGSYSPPDLPPGTAEEIVERLLDLERHLSSYASLSHQVIQQNKALHQDNQDEKIRRAAIDDSIYLLKQDLEKLNSYAKSSTSQLNDLKLFNKDTKDGLKDIQNTILRLDSEVGKHEAELKSRNSKSDSALSEIKSLKLNIDALKRGLTAVEGDLKRISDYEHISKIALKSISEYLPKQLAVHINPKTKRIEINPEFWTALRSVFADREEMERSVAAQAGKIADAKIIQKEISWNEFLRGNEEAIKGFVQVQMDDRWNKAGEDGVIVSRDYFLEILKDQMMALQGDMEGRIKSLVDKFEKSSKENIAKAMASVDKQIKKSSTGRKGDLSTEAINSIVETALHLYSTDTLAKPDYALYSSGARINPLLTSPTYHHSPDSLIKRLGSYILGGAGSTWGHQPAMALFQDTNVGMCWAFPGSQGGLGIRLSEPVLITDVSVEHVHREVSKNIASAPKQWSLYALINDDVARTQIESIVTGLYGSVQPANLPRGYTLLVKGEYDINNEEGRTIQTVPIPAAIRRLNVPVEQVVFAVGSNWGNAEYTCLYRVRVHGQGIHDDEDRDKGFGDDEVV